MITAEKARQLTKEKRESDFSKAQLYYNDIKNDFLRIISNEIENEASSGGICIGLPNSIYKVLNNLQRQERELVYELLKNDIAILGFIVDSDMWIYWNIPNKMEEE